MALGRAPIFVTGQVPKLRNAHVSEGTIEHTSEREFTQKFLLSKRPLGLFTSH